MVEAQPFYQRIFKFFHSALGPFNEDGDLSHLPLKDPLSVLGADWTLNIYLESISSRSVPFIAYILKCFDSWNIKADEANVVFSIKVDWYIDDVSEAVEDLAKDAEDKFSSTKLVAVKHEKYQP